MYADLILFDIKTCNVYEFKLAKPGDSSFYLVPFGRYFPFQQTTLDDIENMEPTEYQIGVGYPVKNKADILRDIQVGITGGLKKTESFHAALRRELAEETGIDSNTLTENNEYHTFNTGRKVWRSYSYSMNKSVSFVNNTNTNRCANTSTGTNKQSVCLTIKGKYEEYGRLYRTLSENQCHEILKANEDKIQYVTFVNKHVFE